MNIDEDSLFWQAFVKNGIFMDKKIKSNIKKTKSLVKDQKSLLKADQKRDKVCTAGKAMMDRKKKS